MKIAMNLKVTSILAFVLLGVGRSWAVENFKDFKRDRLEIEASSNYFYSEANYPASGGSPANLVSGNHYQLVDISFAGRYMPKRNWSVFGWGNIANAESKNSVSTRTNSSFTEGAIGADFLAYSGGIDLVPEFIFVMPFEKIDVGSDNVTNSEGVLEGRSRMILQWNAGFMRPYGWLGFNYRAGGRSHLLPWGVGCQMKGKSFFFGAEIFGYQSLSDDSDTSVQRTTYTNSVNAGSLKFYGVKPSLIDSQIYANWNVSKKWSLQGNGGVTLAGSNAASGFHVGGYIRYTFDFTEGYTRDREEELLDSEVPKGRSHMYQRSESVTSEKIRDFKEETEDGVDQNLFKPRPTPKKKAVSDEQLKQQLNQTEFEIEMKSNKKKKRKK